MAEHSKYMRAPISAESARPGKFKIITLVKTYINEQRFTNLVSRLWVFYLISLILKLFPHSPAGLFLSPPKYKEYWDSAAVFLVAISLEYFHN